MRAAALPVIVPDEASTRTHARPFDDQPLVEGCRRGRCAVRRRKVCPATTFETVFTRWFAAEGTPMDPRSPAKVPPSLARGFGYGWLVAFASGLLIATSGATVWVYMSPIAAAVYAAAVPLLILAAIEVGRRGVFDKVSDRASWIVAASVTVAVALVYLALGPQFNPETPGTGSDRDDALRMGTAAFLAGRDPYAQTTYLDHGISPLPGAFVLATPFHFLGDVAFQNLFWLFAAYPLFRASLGHAGWGLAAWLGLVALSPRIWQNSSPAETS